MTKNDRSPRISAIVQSQALINPFLRGHERFIRERVRWNRDRAGVYTPDRMSAQSV